MNSFTFWDTDRIKLNLLQRFSSSLTNEYIFHEGPNPIPALACAFSEVMGCQRYLACGDESGKIYIFNSERDLRQSVLLKRQVHNNAIFDLKWSPLYPQILSGSGDKSLVVYDIPCERKLHTLLVHRASVKSVCYHPRDSQVFASGSRDGCIRVFDIRCRGKFGHVTHTIESAHEALGTQRHNLKRKFNTDIRTGSTSITSLAFMDDKTLVSCCDRSYSVRYWDLRYSHSASKPSKYLEVNLPVESLKKGGASCLLLNQSKTRLFVACTNSVIYEYDCSNSHSLKLVCSYVGHCAGTSHYIKCSLSPDEDFLISGSNDKKAYIWKTNNGGVQSPVCALEGHNEEVCAALWSPAAFYRIITTSDDNTLRFWFIRNLEEPEEKFSDKIIGRCLPVPEATTALLPTDKPEVFPQVSTTPTRDRTLDYWLLSPVAARSQSEPTLKRKKSIRTRKRSSLASARLLDITNS